MAPQLALIIAGQFKQCQPPAKFKQCPFLDGQVVFPPIVEKKEDVWHTSSSAANQAANSSAAHRLRANAVNAANASLTATGATDTSLNGTQVWFRFRV